MICIGCGAHGPTEFCADCKAQFEAEERAYRQSPVLIADLVDDVMDDIRARAARRQESETCEAA